MKSGKFVSTNVGLPLQHKYSLKWGPEIDKRSGNLIVRKALRIF